MSLNETVAYYKTTIEEYQYATRHFDSMTANAMDKCGNFEETCEYLREELESHYDAFMATGYEYLIARIIDSIEEGKPMTFSQVMQHIYKQVTHGKKALKYQKDDDRMYKEKLTGTIEWYGSLIPETELLHAIQLIWNRKYREFGTLTDKYFITY